MKKKIFTLWLICILLGVVTFASAYDLPEEYIQEGYRMEANDLYLPEGLVTVGLLPIRAENGDILDWDDSVEDNIIDCYGLTDSDTDAYASHHFDSVYFPSSMRRLGVEGVYSIYADTIVLNEGLEGIYCPFYGVLANRLVIPSSLQTLLGSDVCDVSFTEFVVPEDHPTFCTIDGVLFSKDRKTLIAYPAGRTESHYDVPAGTQVIGRAAFMENHVLQTVSLPISLRSIGHSAFSACGNLIGITIPLTVNHIDSYAFADCVSLQRVSLPPSLQHLMDEPDTDTPVPDDGLPHLVFRNCPALHTPYAGDNGFTTASTVPDQEYQLSDVDFVPAILSPNKATDGVPVYTAPDNTAGIIEKLPSGSVISVREDPITWANRNSPRPPFSYVVYGLYGLRQGYVQRSELIFPKADPLLFRYESGSTRKGRIDVYEQERVDSGRTRLNLKSAGQLECYFLNFSANMPWVRVGGTVNGDRIDGYAFIGSVDLFREATGDGKTYGIVVASEIGNRVHLREKANKQSKSLTRFFSGTQLEILGSEGGFYRVIVQGQQGYMMKDYVRIVPEAK